MQPQNLLPSAMIVLSLGSSVGYVLADDWRRAVYWLAAAVITASVTF